MIKRLLLAALATLFSFVSFSQKRTEETLPKLIDKLKTELAIADNDSLRAHFLMRIGENYENGYNPDSAIVYIERSLKLAEKVESMSIVVANLGFLAGAYRKKGNLPKALELCFNAIELTSGYPEAVSVLGPARANLGQIHLALGEYDKAQIVFRDMIRDEEGIGEAFGTMLLARLYAVQEKLDSALILIDLSYKIFHEIKITEWQHLHVIDPELYNIKSKLHLKRGEPELALEALFTSLELTEDNDEAVHTSRTFNDLASYYKQLKRPDSAIHYSKKGLAEAQRINFTQEVFRSSQVLAELYESNDLELALGYYKLATASKDKLYGSGNIQVLKDMIAQKEKKEQELANAELTIQNRLRTNILIGSTFTFILIALLLYRNSRSKHKAKQKIETAYDQLKSTQSQLIHSEKMASLGELTAGIAHEIQNPLNFVNNFSEVNKELMEELNEELEKGNIEDATALAKDVIDNEKKITHHGKRAEAIVKSMLQHSRTSTGEKEPTDINALADEYLRLAYHGFRAKDKSFNANFKTELADDLPKIEVVTQDIGRVLLNLVNNAFQAVKGVENPEVIVRTQMKDEMVQISVRDNGPGVPEDIREKIFQPFFTTKPTGEGTGLGLSLSYDIVKAHGGELMVQTRKGKGLPALPALPAGQAGGQAGSEFIVELPVKNPG